MKYKKDVPNRHDVSEQEVRIDETVTRVLYPPNISTKCL